MSGDDNPIHVDPEFSARTRFGRTVAHGMLLYGALWGLIQEHFPGARQLEQSMRFSAPTYADEPMRLELEVLECREPSELRLAVRVARASDGVVTLEGETRLVLGKGA
ncbi:MAG: MaoC family dehydratase [Gammaproteobacteria bacterium]